MNFPKAGTWLAYDGSSRAPSFLTPPSITRVWVDKNFVYQELHPDVIISFAGQCLLRSSGDPSWWMGEVDKTDGSIVCWGRYGEDLEEAIRNL
jgi:hypothetical protein